MIFLIITYFSRKTCYTILHTENFYGQKGVRSALRLLLFPRLLQHPNLRSHGLQPLFCSFLDDNIIRSRNVDLWIGKRLAANSCMSIRSYKEMMREAAKGIDMKQIVGSICNFLINFIQHCYNAKTFYFNIYAML